MSRYYKINLNSGTSPGPYTIYYDIISSGNIPYIMDTLIFASGLTLTQLGYGVTVDVPDTTTSIILYNVFCDTYQTFNITPLVNYPCLCFIINYNLSETFPSEKYSFCYVGVTINGKPQYQTGDGELLTWNSTGGYWEFQNHNDLPLNNEGFNNLIMRSNYNDNIPDSSWYTVGISSGLQAIISVTQGECNNAKPLYNLQLNFTEPTCEGLNDGSINALATGGEGGWSYSLDGINYSNLVGIFTSLDSGLYTVYAKDISGNTISDNVTLNGTSNVTFNIVGVTNIASLSNVGNMKYYMATINYNTNNIPVGESVTFDYKIVYNLEYTEPGSVIFDTTQHYLTLNGNPISITPSSSTSLNINGVSSCNSVYNRYVGQDNYIANSVVLINGDVFSVNIIYGINTQTNGSMLLPCYTSGNVSLQTYFENTALSCNCCSLLGNSINVTQPAQIYQP